MKCIENIFYLLFSADSDKKKTCAIFRASVPLIEHTPAHYHPIHHNTYLYKCIAQLNLHRLETSERDLTERPRSWT